MEKNRKATEFEKDVFNFLNALRETGVTNMFGAAPYIKESFNVESSEANKLLNLWMKNFNSEGEYETITDC